MPRPQFNRIVHEPPLYSDFKPIGVRRHNLEQIILTLDEFEAFRLADFISGLILSNARIVNICLR